MLPKLHLESIKDSKALLFKQSLIRGRGKKKIVNKEIHM